MNGKNNDEISTFEQKTENNFDLILKAIGEMRLDIGNRLENVETHLDKIDTRLEKVETRLDKIDTRLEKVETRLEKVETRLEKVEVEQNSLRNEFDEFKNFVEIQFEAVRQGIVKNYNQFDRLVSEISQNRSVIYSTKAELGELSERVYLMNRSSEQALK